MMYGAIPPMNDSQRVERWNRECPIGTAVLYQPVADGSTMIETNTTSKAELLGGQIAMITIACVSSPVLLRKLLLQVPSQDSEEEFFLLSLKHSPVGQEALAMWWATNRAGYVTDLRRAGRYVKSEVARGFFDPDGSIVVPVHEALAVSTSIVPWEIACRQWVNKERKSP